MNQGLNILPLGAVSRVSTSSRPAEGGKGTEMTEAAGQVHLPFQTLAGGDICVGLGGGREAALQVCVEVHCSLIHSLAPAPCVSRATHRPDQSPALELNSVGRRVSSNNGQQCRLVLTLQRKGPTGGSVVEVLPGSSCPEHGPGGEEAVWRAGL